MGGRRGGVAGAEGRAECSWAGSRRARRERQPELGPFASEASRCSQLPMHKVWVGPAPGDLELVRETGPLAFPRPALAAATTCHHCFLEDDR